MKIIIMVHALTGGGAERVAASWANGLSSLGHNITIFTNLRGKTYETQNSVKLLQRRILYQDSNSIFSKIIRKLFGPFFNYLQLHKIIKRLEPDAIINVLYIDIYPLLLARLLSKHKFPIVMTDHNAYERPKGSEFKFKQWWNKFIDNRLFDVVTVLTNRDKDILLSRGISNVEVLHNPLFLCPINSIPAKEKIIMAAGRLDAWHCKGFDLLLKAWKDVSKNHPDWKLRIVGDVSDKALSFLKSISYDCSSTIEFVSYTSKIEEEYKKAAIFVLSSRYEGWGLVMVEAMSQGCATIACDYNTRQAEVITDGINGIICKTNDIEELKSKISNLIEDDDLRQKLQENAIPSTKRFAEPIVASKLEALILKYIS